MYMPVNSDLELTSHNNDLRQRSRKTFPVRFVCSFICLLTKFRQSHGPRFHESSWNGETSFNREAIKVWDIFHKNGDWLFTNIGLEKKADCVKAD